MRCKSKWRGAKRYYNKPKQTHVENWFCTPLLEHIALIKLCEKTDSWLHNRQHSFRKGLVGTLDTCNTA